MPNSLEAESDGHRQRRMLLFQRPQQKSNSRRSMNEVSNVDCNSQSQRLVQGAKFPPVSENGGTLIHEIELVVAQEPPLRQLFEIGARHIDAGSQLEDRNSEQPNHDGEHLLNARQVADKLGVSERFIRDHTTRRSPKIPAVKLGKLIRYRCADVDIFMAELGTASTSNRSRFGV